MRIEVEIPVRSMQGCGDLAFLGIGLFTLFSKYRRSAARISMQVHSDTNAVCSI
jgi:hypothetical protein